MPQVDELKTLLHSTLTGYPKHQLDSLAIGLMEMFGGSSPDAKPETNTTTPLEAKSTGEDESTFTDTSSLVSELGTVLAELETHVILITQLKGRLQSVYRNAIVDGTNGLGAAESSDSTKQDHIHDFVMRPDGRLIFCRLCGLYEA